MTKHKYPKGTHVYILEDENKYKIGYTDDLYKRLKTYNTGKANKAEYAYYKKTNCGKEIETCLKAMLNKYIYKSNKEFYDCDIDIIIKKLLKCIKIEKDCNKNKQINQSGGNYIIDNIINIYKQKYDNYIKIVDQL
jgi:predicted GIY-YIG superfamily endonuclease